MKEVYLQDDYTIGNKVAEAFYLEMAKLPRTNDDTGADEASQLKDNRPAGALRKDNRPQGQG